jgi:class 3 adenylate cyclase
MTAFLEKYQKPLSIFLVLFNLAPFLAIHLGHLESGNLVYFYWLECALIGLITIILYLKRLVVFIVLLLCGSLIFQLTDYPINNWASISITFWSLYCLFWLGYIEIIKTQHFEKIRRQHPFKQFSYYLIFMIIFVGTSFTITASMFNIWHTLPYIPVDVYILFFSLTFLIPTIAIGLLKIIDMIGAPHFLHFIFGTYHSPIEQDKIVLFLDMEDSSTIAEKLSPIKSMELIARFIFDISFVLRRNGGDIIQYTGDGLIVTWPRKHVNKAFGAILELEQTFKKTAPIYNSLFELIPKYRIGIHAGTVVVSQIGEEKIFLGLYGDVVNTAARLEQLNKELKTRVLISDTIAYTLNSENMAILKSLGEKKIRGREEKVNVYTIKNNEY